jgi:hypothetical protein
MLTTPNTLVILMSVISIRSQIDDLWIWTYCIAGKPRHQRTTQFGTPHPSYQPFGSRFDQGTSEMLWPLPAVLQSDSQFYALDLSGSAPDP